jgi:hypothetical protein
MEPLPPSKEAGACDASDDDCASSAERQRVAFTFRASSASYLLPALPAPELQERRVSLTPPSHDDFLASVRRAPRVAPSEPKLHSAWDGDEPDLVAHTDLLEPRLEALLAKLEAHLASNPASAASAAFLLAHDEVLVRKVRVAAPTLGRERKLTSCF